MLYLKEFYRKKSTKIYSIILISILFLLFILYSLSNYFEEYINNIYYNNTYFISDSLNDSYDILKDNKNISRIKRVALVETDKYLDLLCENSIGYIILTTTNEDIEGNQVIITIPKVNYKEFITSIEIKKEKIILKDNNYSNSYSIKEIKEEIFPQVQVSQETLNKYFEKSKNYNYIFSIYNYNSIDKTLDELSNNNEISFQIANNIDNSKISTIESLKDTIDLLKLFIKIIKVLFTINLILILLNFVSEETNNMNIARIIGYQNKHCLKIMIIKIYSLITLVFTITAILYFLLKEILKVLFKVNIYININTLIFTAVLIYLILLLFIIFYTYTYWCYKNNSIK